MDIDYLLERLEEALTRGFRVPFSRRTLVDEEECLAIVDQIRQAIPLEVQQARHVIDDRDRVLDEAEEQARLIMERARLDADDRVGEHVLVRGAEARAIEIHDEALRAADDARREADVYAMAALQRLERALSRTLSQVRVGLTELEHGQIAGAAMDQVSPNDS